jgi:ribosome recycling factor
MIPCMAVMTREAWTDERLDDLAKRMDRGFDEVKCEIRDLRSETKSEFQRERAETKTEISSFRAEMNARFNSVDARFDSLEARLDGLNRSLVIGMASMTASIVGALLVTQL